MPVILLRVSLLRRIIGAEVIGPDATTDEPRGT
jgi:hypothetical protein